MAEKSQESKSGVGGQGFVCPQRANGSNREAKSRSLEPGCQGQILVLCTVKSDLLPQTCTPTYVDHSCAGSTSVTGERFKTMPFKSRVLALSLLAHYCITALAGEVIEVTTKGRFLGDS